MNRNTAVLPLSTVFPRAAVLVVLAVALSGCGDDGPSEVIPIEAAYELDVSGALTERASGKAYFGNDEDGNGQPIFALLLGDDTSRHLVIAGTPGESRPAVGSYAIVDLDQSQSGWSLLHMISDGEELLGMFVATDGTLTITESTDAVLRGALEFDAAGFMGTVEDSITVTASFVAVPASQIRATTEALAGVR